MGLFGKKRLTVKPEPQAAAQKSSSQQEEQELFDRPLIPARDLEPLLLECIEQLRNRGLDVPLLFLPFRPGSDLPATRAFIRQWQAFNLRGDDLRRQLLMCDILVVVALLRWALMRVQGGLLDWSTFLLFRATEEKLNHDRNAFQQIVPVLMVDQCKQRILLAFLDLLGAVAAHSSVNGHPGRKLARQCAALFFGHDLAPQLDVKPTLFQTAYTRWKTAAAASEHLFVSYLRSLTMLPKSLEKMLKEDAYPLLPTSDHNACLWTTLQSPKISANPRVLTQRLLLHLQARREVAPLPDAMELLAEESHRLLRGFEQISSNLSEKVGQNATEVDWLDFQDFGFDAKFAAESRRNRDETTAPTPRLVHQQAIQRKSVAPATSMPNWQQFMEIGVSGTLVYHQPLPRIDVAVDQPRAPASLEVTFDPIQQEQASLVKGHIDSGFWGAWMNTMAGESSPLHRSIFGRSVVVMLKEGDAILVVEELLQNLAVLEPVPEKQKKRFPSFKRDKASVRSAQEARTQKVADNATSMLSTDLAMAMRLKKLLDEHRQGRVLNQAGTHAPKSPSHERHESTHLNNLGHDVKRMLKWAEDAKTAPTESHSELQSNDFKRKPVESMSYYQNSTIASSANLSQMHDCQPILGSTTPRPPSGAVPRQSLTIKATADNEGAQMVSQATLTDSQSSVAAQQHPQADDIAASHARDTVSPVTPPILRPKSSSRSLRHADARDSTRLPLDRKISDPHLDAPPVPPLVDPERIYQVFPRTAPERAHAVQISTASPKPTRFWASRKVAESLASQSTQEKPSENSFAAPPIVRRSPLPELVPGAEVSNEPDFAVSPSSPYAPTMRWNTDYDPTGQRVSSVPTHTKDKFKSLEEEAAALQEELVSVETQDKFKALEEEAAALQEELENDELEPPSPQHLRAPSDTSSKYSEGGIENLRRRSFLRAAHQNVMRKVMSNAQAEMATDMSPLPDSRIAVPTPATALTPVSHEPWQRTASVDERLKQRWNNIRKVTTARAHAPEEAEPAPSPVPLHGYPGQAPARPDRGQVRIEARVRHDFTRS